MHALMLFAVLAVLTSNAVASLTTRGSANPKKTKSTKGKPGERSSSSAASTTASNRMAVAKAVGQPLRGPKVRGTTSLANVPRPHDDAGHRNRIFYGGGQWD